jgi:nucleolar GTP-binding protein
VVAGFPTVGKSSLIRALTDAEPEVASYPFTTKECTVGHRSVIIADARGRRKREKLQFVDTPGLLDRPEDERNDIERQAALALKHLADVIVFMLDPSEHCGYPLEKQERLLVEIKKLFPRIPMFVVENKVDIKAAPSEHLKISATTGAGVEELTNLCIHEAFAQKHSAKLEKFLAGEDASPSEAESADSAAGKPQSKHARRSHESRSRTQLPFNRER